MNTRKESIKLVPSVDKAMRILQLLSDNSSSELGISDICNALRFNKSTVHDILNTMLKRDFVARNDQTTKYTLGVQTYYIGNAYFRGNDKFSLFYSVAEQINNKCGENVNYIIPHDLETILVAAVPSRYSLKIDHTPGETMPLFFAASGKIFLSEHDDPSIRALLKGVRLVHPETGATKTISQLIEEVQRIRDNGYAINEGEFEDGVYVVAAPVRDDQQRIVAALSISVPEARFRKKEKSLIELVCWGANRLSFGNATRIRPTDTGKNDTTARH